MYTASTFLQQITASHPSHVLLEQRGVGRATIGDLCRAGNSVAAGLRGAGVRRGDVVGVLIEDDFILMAELYFGIVREHPAYGRALVTLPVCGWAAEVLLIAAYSLATYVLAPGAHGQDLASAIEHYRPTWTLLDAYSLRSLARIGRRFDSLLEVEVGMTHTPPTLWEQLREVFPNAKFSSTYTFTEASPHAVRAGVGAGYPDPEYFQVGVLGPAGEPVPDGEIGEICFEQLSAYPRFYWGDPEATAETFRDGWVYSGDLGYLDAARCLHIVDRQKDFILAEGHAISARSLEDVLLGSPDILDASVFGVASVSAEMCCVAVVAQRAFSVGEVQDLLRASGAPAEVLERVYNVAWIPRNPRGKTLKHELRDWVERGCNDDAPWASPLSELAES